MWTLETKVEVFPATVELAHQLASCLRAQDAAEARALGMEPERALIYSVERSNVAYAVTFNGQLAFIFGVAELESLPDGHGQVWMAGSDVINHHRKTFMRETRRLLDILLEVYEVLVNWIDARYTGALRWGEALGFELQPAVPIGPDGILFHPFFVRRH